MYNELILDRRVYPRWRARLPVMFRVIGEKRLYTGSLSRDVSAGGVKIITDRFLPRGAELKVELFMENIRRLFQVKARLVWIEQLPYRDDGFRAGLEFTEIAPDERRELMRLAKYYADNN